MTRLLRLVVKKLKLFWVLTQSKKSVRDGDTDWQNCYVVGNSAVWQNCNMPLVYWYQDSGVDWICTCQSRSSGSSGRWAPRFRMSDLDSEAGYFRGGISLTSISHIEQLSGHTSTDVSVVKPDWWLERLQSANSIHIITLLFWILNVAVNIIHYTYTRLYYKHSGMLLRPCPTDSRAK